jgi:hypothetical protein
MNKGKNGQQMGQENILLVKAWIAERNTIRDWHEYEYGGKINRTTLADELGFSTSVCTQNGDVRTLIKDADAIWFRKSHKDNDSHEAARERAEKHCSLVSSNNNALIQRIAELEAENRKLHQKLIKYKKQQTLIQAGAAGFKI